MFCGPLISEARVVPRSGSQDAAGYLDVHGEEKMGGGGSGQNGVSGATEGYYTQQTLTYDNEEQ